ncbi:mechanosensitive ion channel family protein [Massilibacteroides vaginae]|uniref:mechanosensitive ion channel family protein n=1 Tax=Massilibacteroides vaginae TaxID=1673718 RepID=UPI000A1CD02C|nr:mechanosensitive ion channel domain-containing protein [Massilibacteroides vaginae]
MEELDQSYGSLTDSIAVWMDSLLTNWGLPHIWIAYIKIIILLILVIGVVFILQYLVKRLLAYIFRRIAKVTNLSFFNHTIANKLPHYLALVVPYTFVRTSIPVVFYDFKSFVSPMYKLVDVYMVFMVIWTIMSLIRSFGNVLEEKPAFKNKPMKSYYQVIQIVFFLFGAVAIYAILTGKSATAFFAAMGAASAVLLLMFKDTIMGFVGSIQISTNDMVRIGDWITMNKYGADGDIEEINLTTVKVRNFDKTITTIPTYSLISDSFQNWRGMKEAGGRRFKRVFHFRYDCVRFMTNEELEKFKKNDALKKYIESKQTDGVTEIKPNERFMAGINAITNIDLYIQYCISYLRQHPKISNDLTLLARELQSTTQGLPVELYSFTNTTVWAEYEIIVAEIVNHLVSVVGDFGLVIYQESAGSDNFDLYIKEHHMNK